MGQYHIPVNLTKREFINPHKLGCGLKQWEQIAAHPSTGTALLILLFSSNHRGGGDLAESVGSEGKVLGRWAGDRIAIVGDYSQIGDIPHVPYVDKIYDQCVNTDDTPPEARFTDISMLVAPIIERELGGQFVGVGWRDFKWEDPDDNLADRLRGGTKPT